MADLKLIIVRANQPPIVATLVRVTPSHHLRWATGTDPKLLGYYTTLGRLVANPGVETYLFSRERLAVLTERQNSYRTIAERAEKSREAVHTLALDVAGDRMKWGDLMSAWEGAEEYGH